MEIPMTVSMNPLDPDDLVQISFVLPARLAVSAQETILRLLAAGAASVGGTWAPTPDTFSDVADAWDMPEWEDSEEDRQRMAWLVGDLDPKHIDVLSGIHNRPNTSTNELLTDAGYPEGTKASGVFRAITNRFRKANRRPLWHGGEHTPDGQRLRSPGLLDEVAGVRLFAEAVKARSNQAGTADAADGVDWDAVVAAAPLTDSDRALIGAFRACQHNEATAEMLAEHRGFEDYRASNLAMGRLGQHLAEARAAVDPSYQPERRPEGSVMWWHVAADGDVRDDGRFWWTLRPGLDAALRRNGI
jgi:hypothetical protein